jgi:hypothetical protein
VCGAPGAPVGERVGLHGHGHRERVQLGVGRLGDQPAIGSVHVRRYRCQRCASVVVVAPRGVLPSMRYAALSVALSLALWSVHRQPGHRIRERVSPHVSSGYEALHGWRALGRWAMRGARIFDLRAGPSGEARALALDVTRKLAARALVASGQLVVDACAGALSA